MISSYPFYEISLACDTDDINYVKCLIDISNPSHVTMNYSGDENRWSILNKALDKCSGDRYMHIENDFYWQNPDCLDHAITVLDEHATVRFVRFEDLPFNKKNFEEIWAIDDQHYGILKRRTPYAFNLNPHLRTDRFPMGRFPETYPKDRQPEGVLAEGWRHRSACLIGENFRHLGLYDEGGHYKEYYAERFTLRRGERTIGNPMEEFKIFCDNPEYIELFEKYLNTHKLEET